MFGGRIYSGDPVIENLHLTNGHEVNLSYSPHSPILIESDDDFETQGWPGNGTQNSPYEISGLSIVADDIDCIKITDTVSYFKIMDCFVSRVTWPDDPIIFSGIKLFNVTNGEIDSIQATHKLEGIFIEKSINCTIWNSQLFDNVWYGCEIRNSTYCTVTNCTFTENGAAGLVARVTTTPPPIRNCIIIGNTFVDNSGDGIHLAYSWNFNVSDNILVRDGWSLYECSNCYGSNNSINESGGISLRGTNCTLENNSISGGLSIGNANNCTIKSNSIHNSNDEGVRFLYASNISFIDNSIFKSLEDGLELKNTMNCTIMYNEVYSNGEHGVAILESSSRNVLYSNIFCNNSQIGIMFDETSFNNSAYDNHLLWNGLANALDNGTANSWDDNVSLGNEWDDYNGIGPYPIMGSAESFDHFPKVADTSLPQIIGPPDFQYDEVVEGQSISWNVSGAVPGQYWIYREHMVIEQDAWSNGKTIILDVDNLSLGFYNFTLVISDILGHEASDIVFVTVIDGTPPSLDSPDDIQFIEGTIGHIIVWHPNDLHPKSFEIEINHVVTAFGLWNSSSEDISYNLDTFTVGTYNVTIIVSDIGDNSISDSVNVIVIPPTTTTTATTTTTSTTTSAITSPTTTQTDSTTSPTITPSEFDPALTILMGVGAIGALVIVTIIVKKKSSD